MKFILLSSCLFFLSATPPSPKSTDIHQVVKVVELFAKSADQRDLPSMIKVLHADFRATVNRAFGSKEVSLMDKTTYLALLKDKKIGGDQRTVQIHSADIQENNAYIKAEFRGKELVFQTYLLLVKTVEGEWKVIHDMPVIKKLK